MIQFTIKTLDSNNHSFTVDDETTVQQLKDKVKDQMGIDTNLQRLIFCGRVLQDDKKLSEYDINGKVVHLVQRAPPSPESRHHAPPNPSNTLRDNVPAGARLMAMGGIPEDAYYTYTFTRIEFIRRMITEIKYTLTILRAHRAGEENSAAPGSSDTPVETPETEPNAGTTQEEPPPHLDELPIDDMPPDFSERANLNPRRRSYRAMLSMRARSTRPQVLAQLVDELETLNEQFTPHRATYVRLLRYTHADANGPTLSEEERSTIQRTTHLVRDLMHSFAHAYHAVSEIYTQVGPRNVRLFSDAPTLRRGRPMHAQINVIQTNRRTPSATGNNTNGNGATGSAATPAAGQATASATPTQASESQPMACQSQPQAAQNQSQTGQNQPQPGQNQQQTGQNQQTGRNQPTVNINIQPYQVEIETRVPLAFALENALLNGLTAANININSQNQNTQQQPNAAAQNEQQENSENNQGQNQQNQQSQPNQQNPQIRRQVLLDSDNIFNGLINGANLGGVEVLMSMEEMPQAPPGSIAVLNPMTQGLAPDAPLHVGNIPWGGPPGTDLLQNIVASLIRQGLVPGVELHVQGDNQENNASGAQAAQVNQNQNNQTNVSSGQTNQNQGQANLGNAYRVLANQVETIRARTNQAQANQAQANQAQGNQAQANTQANTTQSNQDDTQNGQRQQPFQIRRQATTSRGRSASDIVYDNFLICDNMYSRERTNILREQFQVRMLATERLRSEMAQRNSETVRDGSANLRNNHIQTVVELLNGPPSPEARVNALVVAIARQLFLSHPVSTAEPMLIPNEFQALRTMLRNGIQDLLRRAEELLRRAAEGDTAFEGVADFLVNQYATFISRMHTVAPLRQEIDAIASIRALVRSHFPGVMASVMSENNNEMYAVSFYVVFGRLYTDLLTLMMHICLDGLAGMRVLYNEFLEFVIRRFPADAQEAIRILSIENFTHVVNNNMLVPNVQSIQQYVRLRPHNTSRMHRTQRTSTGPTPMEFSPPSWHRDEPMQTTPPATPSAPTEQPYNDPRDAEIPLINATFGVLRNMAANNAPSTITSRDLISNGQTSQPTRNASTPLATPDTPSSATSNRPPLRTASQSTPNQERGPKPSTQNGESNSAPKPDSDNVRFVPPKFILQHWDEGWMPVFTRDQQSQSQGPQTPEPYSDAYLTGMPSRKRRCVRQARPPTTLDEFMNESIREASDRTAPAPERCYRLAFREHMRQMARNRAASSPDWNPAHHAPAASFLHAPRTDRPDQPEESNEPKDNI